MAHTRVAACLADNENFQAMVKALNGVSFYAQINHGDKCKDYGEIVDPVLVKLGVDTGQP